MGGVSAEPALAARRPLRASRSDRSTRVGSAGTRHGGALARLPAALAILAAQMHQAAAERRAAPPGSARYRRADALVVHLNGLYGQLQRPMAIPDEIWRLGPGPSGGAHRS